GVAGAGGAAGLPAAINKAGINKAIFLKGTLVITITNYYQSRRFVMLTEVRLSKRWDPKLTGGKRIRCRDPSASCTVTTIGFDGAVRETSPSRFDLIGIDTARREAESEAWASELSGRAAFTLVD